MYEVSRRIKKKDVRQKCLEMSGNVWKCLKMSGNVWKCYRFVTDLLKVMLVRGFRVSASDYKNYVFVCKFFFFYQIQKNNGYYNTLSYALQNKMSSFYLQIENLQTFVTSIDVRTFIFAKDPLGDVWRR